MTNSPALLMATKPEQAVRIGSLLLTRGWPVDRLPLDQPASLVPVESVVRGWRLPELPDFLKDHTLTASDESARLSEVLGRMARLVSNLWKWQNCAFSLRLRSRPQTGAVDLAILLRVRARPGAAQPLAQAAGDDVVTLLSQLGLTSSALDDSALRASLNPFGRCPLVEVRQHEEVAQLSAGDAYVVHPFWAPAGDFVTLFDTMLRQQAPALVNLHLEPTRLLPGEGEGLAQAASVAQTLGQFQFSGHYYQGSFRDPNADLVGRLYAANLRRLSEPFLIAAQVAGPHLPANYAIARSLGTAIMSPNPTSSGVAGQEGPLPSGFDLLKPGAATDEKIAFDLLETLSLAPWGKGEASPGKERLRYLADAQGATALFRLPVSVRGGVPGVAVRQTAPGFETGIRAASAAPDQIEIGRLERGGVFAIAVQDLTRHGLIAGYTGSGKTNTVLWLLDQLWRKHHVPFLVIEPIKGEYRGLISQPGFENTLVFTLGDETTSPFRLNPFELLPDVRLEAHLAALKDCFSAALPQFGILPSIIEEALEEIYKDKGWRLTDRGARPSSQAGDSKLFPTMKDMFAAVIRSVEGRGYSQKMMEDIRAAAAGRLGTLLRGSKGRMFNTRRSLPLGVLLSRPAILELGSLNDDEKALAMMFFLTLLREHCETTRQSGDLAHLTVIEEAHRVMENVASHTGSEVVADTRSRAVAAFSALLAEIRSYGEGILIAEQSPEKLAPDAVRNTNLKLAHRLVAPKDREIMAGAMLLDQQGQSFLGRMGLGQAAVYTGGQQQATFATVPSWKKQAGFVDRLPDAQVAAHMNTFRRQFLGAYLPFDGCRFCGSPCQYREAIEPVTLDKEVHERLRAGLLRFNQEPALEHHPAHWRVVSAACHGAANQAGHGGQVDAAYCYLAHEIDFAFTRHMRDRFVIGYREITGG